MGKRRSGDRFIMDMAVTERRNFYCRTRFDASHFFQLFSKILVIRVLLNCAVWQGFIRGLA